MSSGPRAAARAIFDAALAAGDVRPLVRRALARVELAPGGRVVAVGAGKASGPMATAAEETLGERIAGGLVAVKDGHGAPTHRIRLAEAGHPVPDARGAAAAREILDLAAAAGPDDVVLVLISGGGSALLPAPVPPITLEEKQTLTRLLLRAGATINQLNAVRKHCSRLKGGQLARAAAPARVVSLLLSDVIGDPLDVIASGPTAPDDSTFGEALAILERLAVRDGMPRSILDRLRRGAAGELPETPKAGDPLFARVENAVIGNNQLVVDAALSRCRDLGLAPHLLGRAVEGEAREVGRGMVALGREIAAGRGPVRPPACVIAAGETTVTVRGNGLGGRAQEMALSAALDLDGSDGLVLLAAGTDGSDGPTPAAGGIADGGTAARIRGAGRDPAAALADNDAHPALAAAGDLIVTGPTSTNLLDLYLLVVAG